MIPEALRQFHLSCKKEYDAILTRFRLFFYGYGCKQSILAELFPSGKIFNLKLQRLADITAELVMAGYHTHASATLLDIDRYAGANGLDLTLILINFDFRLTEIQALENIRVVGTLENIHFTFEKEQLVEFNFVMRDLTTFENYTDEVGSQALDTDRVPGVLMILESVPKKAQAVFCELLKLRRTTLTELYEKVKVPLLLRKKQSVVDALAEFVDHDVVKMQNGDTILVKLTKDECEEVLKLRGS